MGMPIHKGKEMKMNTMGLPIGVFGTDEKITVTPMIAFECDGTVTFYMIDEYDRALWFESDGRWVVDRDGRNYACAESSECVPGEADEEVEGSASGELAVYGFRLGDFDEEHGDRYYLVAL